MEFGVDRIVRALASSVDNSPRVYQSESEFVHRAQRRPEIIALRQKRIERVVNLLTAKGNVVVDAGCGTGLNAVLMINCGAAHVYAIDHDPNQWSIAKLLFDYLDLAARVDLVTENILEVDLPAGSVSAVYSFEFMEHVADLFAYHSRIYRWLKSCGRVYGRSGANKANPLKRRKFLRLYGDWDRERFSHMRREIIAKVVLGLSKRDLDQLVENTRGLDFDGIHHAVSLWKKEGIMPSPNELAPCNPFTGSFEERLLDPKELIATMEASGFNARLLRPDFRAINVDSPFRYFACRIAGSILRISHPASVVLSPWLEVIGIKR